MPTSIWAGEHAFHQFFASDIPNSAVDLSSFQFRSSPVIMTTLEYGLSLTTGAFTGPMHGAQSAVRGFSNQLSNAGNAITGLANIPNAIQTLVAPLTKPITLAADVEVLDKSLTTLLGSGEAAGRMLKDVIKFAAETPFQITEVAPAAKETPVSAASICRSKTS